MATVYKILSPCLQECYVGSTTMKVEKRWTIHRSKGNNCRSHVLFDKYGYDNCKFVVMEVCPLEERREKEQWWMDHSVGLVNKNCAILDKEKKNEYYKENKEKCLQYQKQRQEANRGGYLQYQTHYYEANKERIKEQRRMRRESMASE